MAACRPERLWGKCFHIEIAQSTKLRPIAEIAEELGIQEEELELYGKYKAKINERPSLVWRTRPTANWFGDRYQSHSRR